jgi:NADH dehydrogenase (ubiquinone) Fe-S protein 1
MILRALSEEIGSPLPYDSLDEIRTRMAELAPHLVRFDYIENSGFEKIAMKPSG